MKVLVSGALTGLGASLTKVFLERGHQVFAGVRSTDNLMELQEVSGHPALTILPLDVTRKAEMEKAREEIIRLGGELDALINVAGVLLHREQCITENSYEDLALTFAVNTIGPAYLCNLLLEMLSRSPDGVVVNITSDVKSIDGVDAEFGAYCMSKTALAQHAFILKSTFRQLGLPIRVFAVHPGQMKTRMGAEYGKISARESAEGIYRIVTGEVLPDNRNIYVDYRGLPLIP